MVCFLSAALVAVFITMLTKTQKAAQVKLAQDLIGKSKTLIFADFTGVGTAQIRRLKIDANKAGATFRVIKKRLLNIALKNSGIDYDPLRFEAQVGTFFVPEDLSSVAGVIYKFAKSLVKEKKEFKVLGAYDIAGKIAVSAEEFTAVAKLPSREILLAMLMGAITGPLRAFVYILAELSKKTADSAPAVEEKVATQQ